MLTPPTVEQYGTFIGETFDADPADPDRVQATARLLEATDALWIMTGLTEYTGDEQVDRVIGYAIMDLTRWLQAQFEVADEINSPFSGERIGSYSYQKQQMSISARSGHETGIYWLDLVLGLLRAMSPFGGGISVTSENVMSPHGLDFSAQQWLENRGVVFHDPSIDGTAGWLP